jgi:hypothetical protein
MTRPRALDFALPGSAKLKPIQWPTVVDKDPPHPLVGLRYDMSHDAILLTPHSMRSTLVLYRFRNSTVRLCDTKGRSSAQLQVRKG